MCAVSAVYNYASELPDDWWNTETFKKYKELIEKAEGFDAVMGNPKCDVSDEEKEEFIKTIDKLLTPPEDV